MDDRRSPTTKRRRVRSPSPPRYKLDDEEDGSYEPYIPIAQRRQQKLARLVSLSGNADTERARQEKQENEERQNEILVEQQRKEKERRERTLLIEAQEVHLKKAAEGANHSSHSRRAALILRPDAKKTEDEKAREAEAQILEAIKSRRKLASDLELAQGIQYTDILKTR
jgi:ATP-dependent RNA helicase DDX41